MKTIFALFLAGVIHAGAQASTFTNFIRQSQQLGNGQTGVVWDMPVAPTGDSLSPLKLDKTASLFQLWTIDQTAAVDYLLDQKLVSTYLPTATVTIKTLDPYPGAIRTRVDKPFIVTVNVQGLVASKKDQKDPTVSSVILQRFLGNYPAGHPQLNPVDVLKGTPYSSNMLTAIGDTVLTFPASSLTAADPTKASGEEYFTVSIPPDPGFPITQIAGGYVQVWPVASGKIKGIAQGDLVRFQIPQIELLLNDLYPSSQTYLLLFKGSQITGQEGVVVSSFPMDRDTSESHVISVSGLETKLGEDGTYTIALVSDTVYGRELLCNPITFTTNRTLSVNAMQTNFSDDTSKP